MGLVLKGQPKGDIFKIRPQEQLYIALEDLDFSWTLEEIEQALQKWNEGLHIGDIAEEMQREEDEVFLLLLDQARKGVIQYRENGIFGSVING